MCESLDSQIDRLAKFILEEVPGYPRATEDEPNGMGAVDAAIYAIRDYQTMAYCLYSLLDNIDTIDDMARGDDKLYRNLVVAEQKKKQAFFESTDGQTLTRTFKFRGVDPEPDRPECKQFDTLKE